VGARLARVGAADGHPRAHARVTPDRRLDRPCARGRATAHERDVFALDLAARTLKPGGAALIKVFQGAGLRELVESARKGFARVRLVKPLASRSRSPEMYLLAMQFRLV